MRIALLALVGLLVGVTQSTAVAEPIGPAEALDKVGEEVTVVMEVKSAALRDGMCFLNSESNFRSDDNLTIFIDRAALAKFKEADIEDPATHFRGKKIQVAGTVGVFRERKQIAVGGPNDVKLADEK